MSYKHKTITEHTVIFPPSKARIDSEVVSREMTGDERTHEGRTATLTLSVVCKATIFLDLTSIVIIVSSVALENCSRI